ncbi:MAG: hypothetical protein ABIR10_16970 [Dokdonella sp.]
MSTARKRRAVPALPNPIADMAGYFDASLTDGELSALRREVSARTGLSHMQLFHSLEPAAAKVIGEATGIYYRSVPEHWVYIHIAKELGISYKGFARNQPKHSIAPFVTFAKKHFQQLRGPLNGTQRAIAETQVHMCWNDWMDANCPCGDSSHWLCNDTFAPRDYDAIIDEITIFNATRPRMVPLRLVAASTKPIESAE